MTSQSPGSPNQDSFEKRSPETKNHLDVGAAERHKVLYGGRWWLPPSSGYGESCESRVARGLP
jgi:hypothetical protein